MNQGQRLTPWGPPVERFECGVLSSSAAVHDHSSTKTEDQQHDQKGEIHVTWDHLYTLIVSWSWFKLIKRIRHDVDEGEVEAAVGGPKDTDTFRTSPKARR
ncbi:unnamed protein product [Prorocentrum cordatum]|uniref:Uncharacterized protein n=1 Tax=Prorocentrum cordatum TaxID=2364126 RepID=A0ABN9WCI8_9DINO|nr:unnamed protein product [Polarella glacialis]